MPSIWGNVPIPPAPDWFNDEHWDIVLHNARDTTARESALAELRSMTRRPSQHNVGEQIPEKSWVYRIVKKHFFGDFGAYDAPVSPLAEKQTPVESQP